MLVEFSVSNFRSIKDLQILSFSAAAINEHEPSHVFHATDKIKLLKSIAVYGANGSGKSNLVRAMWAMVNFIRAPFDERKNFEPQIRPFQLNTFSRNEGTFFQIIFVVDKKKFRYGFEYLKGKIISEWLFGTAEKKEINYFIRDIETIVINRQYFKEGSGLEPRVHKEKLFLNVVFEFNGSIATTVRSYFESITIIKSGNEIFEELQLRDYSNDFLKYDKNVILHFLKSADADIVDLTLNENAGQTYLEKFGIDKNKKIESIGDFFNQFDGESMAKDIVLSGRNFTDIPNNVISKRKLFDEHGTELGTVDLDFNEEASDGTKKMFAYSGIFSILIENGGVIVIDEFDARLHTMLIRAIVQLFNSSKNKSAQLCFVTHDTNLLDKDLLRRDQIYFAEKNTKGETDIYSLADFKGIRNNDSIEKDYIKGKYGAIPFIKNLNSIFE